MRIFGRRHNRKFGQWHVTINRHRISIEGDWHTNNGIIYNHYVDSFLADPNRQIIGMDNSYGLTKQVLAYVHDYVRKHAKYLAKD